MEVWYEGAITSLEGGVMAMIGEMWCPKCEGDAYHLNGFVRGLQRYKCKGCGCNFTQRHKHGVPRSRKMLALLLYISGVSMTRTAQIIGVSPTSIVNWVREFGREFALPDGHGEVVEVEMDEMWHYLQSKKNASGSGELLSIRVTGCSDIFVVPERKGMSGD